MHDQKQKENSLGEAISVKDEQISTLKTTFQNYELKIESMEMINEKSKQEHQNKHM